MGSVGHRIRANTKRSAMRAGGHFSWALIATTVVVVIPSATVTAFVRFSQAAVNPFVTWAITAVFSATLLMLGTGWWIRQPGSTTMSFGELMLWRWVRRRNADEKVAEGARVFGTSAAPGIATTRRGQLEMLRSLNAALETRDPYTRGHARRVERHSYRTGLAMHLSVDDIFDLRLAASLHDIGKIEVPIEIIRKQGPLDADEWATMKQHSAIGADIIANLGNPQLISAVRYHHERWDGSGYPEGLKGEEIPLHARIIGVCDSFDAITSNRPYRAKSNRKKAIAILKEQSGKQFDPKVVDAFLSALPRGLPGLAALSWLSFPALQRVVSQIGGLARNAGTVGVASAIAASGVTGVVATNVHPSKYLYRPAVERAARPEPKPKDETKDTEKVPAIELPSDPAASGVDVLGANVRKGESRARRRQQQGQTASRPGVAAEKSKGRGVVALGANAAKQDDAPPGQAKKKKKEEEEESTAAEETDVTDDDAQVDHGKKGNGEKADASDSEDSNDDDSDDNDDDAEEKVDEVVEKVPPGKGKPPKGKTTTESTERTTTADEVEDSDDDVKGKGKAK